MGSISDNYRKLLFKQLVYRRTPRFSLSACFLIFRLGGNCQIHLSLLLNLRHKMANFVNKQVATEQKNNETISMPLMSALEELVLSCSGTESIENTTFKALSTLKSLELYKNQLKQIPTFLPSGLIKLRVLDIRNNLIASLLILDGNNMESVSAPLKLPRLKYLSMADNKLNSFPANFFASFQNLQFLSLSSNFLTEVPLDLPRSLLSLKIEKNQLKTVRLRDMKHLENLSEFFLSENQLTSVDGAQLLLNLTTLELSKNQLHTMPLRLPGRLQKLDCSNNLIQRVTAQDFQGLQDLKHLFLDNNAVSMFEAGALQQCAQLSNLALEQNLLISIPLRQVNLRAAAFESIRQQLYNQKVI
uniref:Nephrocan-like n=1 Tax=Athene cunicularia TaxID=194338 RepID=A0A663LZT0_ATHCN